jgi:4-hydroxy-3-polyprenylbenzoate decarboxylase
MRIVLGVTGASGSIFAVEFLRRLGDVESYLILSRWGKSVLHQETGLTPESLATFTKRIFANDDLNAPLASGSNPFDALFIVCPARCPPWEKSPTASGTT